MIPPHRNRSPEEIIEENNYFESSGRIYKAISWLDYANKNKNISALEYAAFETRIGIEQLIFEQLIVSVGTELEISEYKKCKGSAKKLDQIINKLISRYEKLVDFSIALGPKNIPITKWNNKRLIEYSGRVSTYLHWSGGLDVTIQSQKWFENGMRVVGEAANYIWHGLTTGNTGIMPIEKLEPEIKELWILYELGKITIESVITRAEILLPILEKRLTSA